MAIDLIITFPTIYFFFVETKQKSLEEIDLLFGGRALGTLSDDVWEKAEGTRRANNGSDAEQPSQA